MLKIEVFGGGCPKCKQTEMNSKEALVKLGVKAEIVAVKNQVEILKKGVTSTPVLAINDEVKCMGRIPKTKEIITWLQDTK